MRVLDKSTQGCHFRRCELAGRARSQALVADGADGDAAQAAHRVADSPAHLPYLVLSTLGQRHPQDRVAAGPHDLYVGLAGRPTAEAERLAKLREGPRVGYTAHLHEVGLGEMACGPHQGLSGQVD